MTVVEVKGRSVKIGFSFPPDASIMRKELHEKIMQENLRAAGSIDDLDILGAIDFNDKER